MSEKKIYAQELKCHNKKDNVKKKKWTWIKVQQQCRKNISEKQNVTTLLGENGITWATSTYWKDCFRKNPTKGFLKCF